MDVQFGPNSHDEPNLLYKLQRKIKVFNTSNPLSNRGYNLVTSSSKYGVVFIASPTGSLSVYQLQHLIAKDIEPLFVQIQLQEKPTHIAVSCDQELLAVTGGQLLSVYKITNFQNQNVSPSITIKNEVSLSTFVSAMQWNPCIPDTIAMAFYDGTLTVCQVSSGQLKKVPSKARCICWSPKGKQLVTGNNDGTLSQYKPDLTPAKMIPPPKLFEGSPVEALAIYWISTFQFAVVYRNATDNSRPAVTIVNTPKTGPPYCLNYEDICYSIASNRPWYYYLLGLAQWNLIMSSSSNSMEIATLGSTDGASWIQWCQPDEARPELPLTDKKQENYPVGLCIDTSAVHQLPWGENETLPFMPMLLVVSQSGMLTIFNIINLNRQAPQLCVPPQQITLPAGAMISNIPDDAPAQPQPQPVVQHPAATLLNIPKPQIQPQIIPQAQPTPQPAQTQPVQVAPQTTTQFAGNKQFTGFATPQPKPFGAALPQVTEQKPPKPAEVPTPVAAPQPTVKQEQNTAQVNQQTAKAQEANAALKAEQELKLKKKAEKEIQGIFIKEANLFQGQLYNFLKKAYDKQNVFINDLKTFEKSYSPQILNTVELKELVCLEELRAAIMELKHDLIRNCAAVAEARTYAEVRNQDFDRILDPYTLKRVEQIKSLAYYVQTQLEHAQQALEYKWKEVNRYPGYYGSNIKGQRMIRPILDDVYQPLVKQQEILSRQQAVLKTLRSTLEECDCSLEMKALRILKTKPFKKQDEISKVTKNMLNMRINGEDPLWNKKLESLKELLANQKTRKITPQYQKYAESWRKQRLALKDTTDQIYKDIASKKDDLTPEDSKGPRGFSLEIKPFDDPKTGLNSQNLIECILKFGPSCVPEHLKKYVVGLENIPAKYFNSAPQPLLPTPPPQIPAQTQQPQSKPVQITQQNRPTMIPINVPTSQKPTQQTQHTIQHHTQETPKLTQLLSQPPLIQPQPSPQTPKTSQQAFSFGTSSMTVTPNTRSVLKDMLQNKQALAEVKSDTNSFMGQKICSPTAFETTQASNLPSFTSKPISGINNMFNKFTPQAFGTEAKPQPMKPKTEPVETEVTETVKLPSKPKEEKPITNLFGLKTISPTASAQNVPDVLKSNFATIKTESKPLKPVEKETESKENILEKSETPIDKITETPTKPPSEDKKEIGLKPFSLTTATKPSVFATPISAVTTNTTTVSSEAPKTPEVEEVLHKQEPLKLTTLDESTITKASSLFAAANAASPTEAKPQPLFGSPPTTTNSIVGSPKPATSTESTTKDTVTTTTSSAASLFGNAAANSTFGKSTIFSSTSTTSSSVFGTSTPAAFSTTTTTQSTSIFGTATTQSADVSTTASESKPSVFSTPTPATASVFGAPASQASVFGSTTASIFETTATTSQSLFSTTTTPSQSVFGSTTTTTQSVFSGTPSTQASIFDSAATNTQSVFGATTPTSQTSIFGAVATPPSAFGSPTTQASIFGATTQTSVFGSPTATTQTSAFGSPTQTTQASLFGSSQTTQASVFAAATTQASVFGSPATTTQSSSLFGGAESNLFAAASISTTSASSPTSGGSIFGGSPTGSVFGGGNVFGGKPTFGQAKPTAAAIFGGGAAFAPKQDFWGGKTGEPFGSSGFGQQATTQASSLFSGATGGSFSAPATGQPFGSPTQSVFGGQQQQTASSTFGGSAGFGSKAVFGQPTGFGSQPTGGGGFGSPPAFGAAANKPTSGWFGGSPTFSGGFGGAPAFGSISPVKAFGGPAAPAPGFGSPTQSNATFESLATQNTLTFGNLAQQSGPTPAAPGVNTSPSFTGWRS